MSIVYLWSIHDRVFNRALHIYSLFVCPMIEIQFNIEFVKWRREKTREKKETVYAHAIFFSEMVTTS